MTSAEYQPHGEMARLCVNECMTPLCVSPDLRLESVKECREQWTGEWINYKTQPHPHLSHDSLS